MITDSLQLTKMIPRANAPEKKNIMAGKMEKIKEEVCKLRVDMDEFNLMSSDSDASIEPPVTDVIEIEEPIIVGRDKQIQRIMESIPVQTGHCTIVHIYGQDGSGKTTLARMVFNHTRFKDYSRVWIQCSGNFRLHEMGKAIISRVSGEEINGDSNDDMEYVRKRLDQLLDNGIKVLVVLDDIHLSWGDSEELTDLLRERNNLSEVIVVTTGRGQLYFDSLTDEMVWSIYDIRVFQSCSALSDDMCWTIIKQRSHFEGRSFDKQAMEQVGAEIAKRCQGSPLAAAVLGGVLLYKDATGWAEILNSDIWAYNHIGEPFLMLAYTSMPPSLRLCLAYCAMIQYGHTIGKDDLIYQWTSLGLLESDKFSMIQLREQYIGMLLDMSLLQTVPVSTSRNGDKSTFLFTMNNMVQSIAKLYMCDIYNTMETSYQGGLCSNSGCRYVLLNNFKSSSKLSYTHIRALRCVGSGIRELIDDSLPFSWCLRVLDLNDRSMLNLPDSIYQLRHLGYLNLSGCSGLVILPESLGDLLNLLYIDLSGCSGLRNLPESFGKLTNLAHIELSGCSGLANLPDSLGKLTSLKHIDLSGCSGLVNLPDSFGKLTSLKHIDLSGCSRLVNLPDSFGKLTSLKHIDLSGCSGIVNLPDSFGKLTSLKHIDLSGCSGLVNLPDSFGKLTSLKHIDLSGCSGLEKLPQSFVKLINLVHINLSQCSGLVSLPLSFGKLIYLLHINLSGCSGLVNLPESFGNLVNLVHINLSGCCGLLNLPGSFGNLINLLHIDLSYCHGLGKLPESFRKLKFLVHLDLSFWSCFEGVEKALGGLTNLQHLNLSHPCCYLAQQQSCLEGLKDVLGKLTKLEYLNLSMFLNPICYSKTVERTHEFIECISVFSSLEHLDLSHNKFLHHLPESLGELNNLQRLDLSGCMRLKSIAKRIGEIKSLKSIHVRNCRSLKSCQLVVKADNGETYRNTNIVELEDANLEELEISCLENVKTTKDAERIRMALEGRTQKLKLCWTVGSQVSMEGNTLLGKLLPSHLQCLELHGYSDETRLSAWWTSTTYGETCLAPWWTATISFRVSTLVEVTIEDFPRCSCPPPLCLLQNLRRAVFRRMASITRFNVNDLTDGNRAAIHRLPKFTLELDDMESLEEFKTTYDRRGKECVLPAIGELVITGCPKLCFGPFTPRARRLVISDCSKLMVYSWWNRGGQSVETPITSVLVNELVVKNCNLALYNWTLLHSLPGLYSLTVKDCRDLKTLPRTLPHTIEALSSLRSLCLSNCLMEPLEQHLGDLTSLRELKIASCNMFKGFTRSLQRLTSLGLMHLSDCNSITSLPEWLGDLTNLEKLAIHRCPAIESLPGSINKLTNLKDLHILDCPKLKGWCERKENKKIMAHIRPNYEEHGTSRPGSKDEGEVVRELKDWSDCKEEDEEEDNDGEEEEEEEDDDEEEEEEAVLAGALETSVVTDNTDVGQAEAVLPDVVENPVVTGNTDAEEEEARRDVDAAAAADVCLELRLGLPSNEEPVHIREEDEISLRLYL
ncbi:hypothetical protein CFC21_071833 [Triticum aestivum]|uniref:NB-ARC domain-containing protein n=2 Tax=Triticum aestivum TaxID=4565 RepID=A0A9R1HI80_WHEAT|nr:hypothetical protein CFC21_071833 [Triticum aestivum]